MPVLLAADMVVIVQEVVFHLGLETKEPGGRLIRCLQASGKLVSIFTLFFF